MGALRALERVRLKNVRPGRADSVESKGGKLDSQQGQQCHRQRPTPKDPRGWRPSRAQARGSKACGPPPRVQGSQPFRDQTQGSKTAALQGSWNQGLWNQCSSDTQPWGLKAQETQASSCPRTTRCPALLTLPSALPRSVACAALHTFGAPEGAHPAETFAPLPTQGQTAKAVLAAWISAARPLHARSLAHGGGAIRRRLGGHQQPEEGMNAQGWWVGMRRLQGASFLWSEPMRN